MEIEGRRFSMQRESDGMHRVSVPRVPEGARYSLIVDGQVLMDPYATGIDGPWTDTIPQAVVRQLPPPVEHHAPLFTEGGLIYEIAVRAFTMLHPDIAPEQRGTLRALLHPAVIAHLKKLRVSAVELMPIQAWIDDRHLPALGLRNAWGYNTMNFMAVDPRLGTLADLRDVIAALHGEGIGVILDVAFNHTGESDRNGPALSLRGLDERAYYRETDVSGCGNSIDCEKPAARRLVLESLRHFVRYAGVDGYRFDLATILGRTTQGFDPSALFFQELLADPVLADRILIAEPWDVGEGGYQLGRFPKPFLEWNDRYRDDVRRFWRGDSGTVGDFVTRLAGSSDIFEGERTRTVNFIAAHDGFTLRDLVSYQTKQNHPNGEDNRDGADNNYSWMGKTSDVHALLATLFTSSGTIMLTAGDEFGRTQLGNNNAYAQDNQITWLDWSHRDLDLENFTAGLAQLRADKPRLSDPRRLPAEDVEWLQADGTRFTEETWNNPATAVVGMRLPGITVWFDSTNREVKIVPE